MPELPEVEIYRRRFEACALRKRIDQIEITDRRILHGTTVDRLRAGLEGRRFTTTRRHGKHLFARASGGPWLYLHFGMTGDLHCGTDVPRFAKLVIRFPRRQLLAFEDMRLFGRVGLVDDPDEFIEDKRLGVDPLGATFGFDVFDERLAKRRGAIKALLMNQSVIAGLGNLWVDETLFQTGFDPRAPVEKLTRADRRKVFDAVRRILRTAIERQEQDRAMPANYLFENRELDALCPRCHGAGLRRTVVAGRTTYYCPAHQV